MLSRVPPSHRTELVAHFNAMLDANGIQAENRFVIPETGIVDGFLPDDIFQPIRDWLNDTAQHADRRVAVLSQTMAGMLDTFKTRVPRLAAHVDAQVVLGTRLRREAENAYATALADFDEGTRGGRLLAGEVLARWQDYAASGDLGAALRGKRGTGDAARRQAGPHRRDHHQVRGAGDGAARRAAGAGRLGRRPRRRAGGARLAGQPGRRRAARRGRGEPGPRRARQARVRVGLRHRRGGPAGPPRDAKQGAFDRSSPDLPLRVSRAVSAWQDQLMRLMQSDVTRRPGGSAVQRYRPGERGDAGRDARGPLMAGAFAPAPPGERPEKARTGSARCPGKCSPPSSGTPRPSELITRARHDLRQRVGLLLDEELLRFGEVIDEAGPVDAVAAVRLYQAEYSLEAAR